MFLLKKKNTVQNFFDIFGISKQNFVKKNQKCIDKKMHEPRQIHVKSVPRK